MTIFNMSSSSVTFAGCPYLYALLYSLFCPIKYCSYDVVLPYSLCNSWVYSLPYIYTLCMCIVWIVLVQYVLYMVYNIDVRNQRNIHSLHF